MYIPERDSEGRPITHVSVKEEDKSTGGHYQAQSFEFDVGAGDATKTLNITFPHPISLLAAEWSNKSAFSGDSIEFQVAPDTIIGTLSADEASGQTVISVSSTVLDNIQVGYGVKLDDGTNADDLDCCTAIDKSAGTITVETATTNSFTAATPTYVKMTVFMLRKSKIPGDGRVQLGESKIGGSYISAGTVLRGIYHNDISTAKKLIFFLEYLY